VNIPSPELDAQLAEHDRSREIVAHYRGRYSVLLYQAAALLQKRGFGARWLEDGLPEWQAAGLPIEAGLGTSVTLIYFRVTAGRLPLAVKGCCHCCFGSHLGKRPAVEATAQKSAL
jgi:hypothetical protein